MSLQDLKHLASVAQLYTANHYFTPVDAGDLTGQPKRQVWAWQPWVPAGVVTGLAGPAGVAKSTLALQLCIHKALGVPLFGDPIEQGNSVFATTEDDQDELHRRLHRICAAMKVPVAALKGKLMLLPLAAEAPMLVTVDRDGRVLPTDALGEFETLLKVTQTRLVVLDLLNDYWSGSENIRAEVTPFIRKHLGGMASRLQCGLIGLSHPSVAAINDGRVFAGSTAVIGSVRSGISMMRDQYDEELIHLTVEKANYAKKGQTASMRWDDGYLRHVSATEKEDEQRARERKACQAVLDVLRGRASEWLSRDDIWQALGSETKNVHGAAARNKPWVEKRLYTLTKDGATVQGTGKGTNRNERFEWKFASAAR
jgi:RecA-family ATPase